ncbi:hypothetical protein K6119_09715 [Paracrocinitomix mangrovi]|uniref:hypothetical protein n=1 Tax=Paracrocinitomix mangrovi TaxID=2862509 RepID=UPI001C8CF600|nr:hypothetical protein [Paracrocinitomix mangrovi]UKN03766.1 hypothetical protein K6119_09715 [Paracrocinitomix mangrovi]
MNRKYIIEFFGGIIVSLLTIKGLSLLTSVIVALILGQTKSKIMLFTDLALLSTVILPILLGLIILITLIITFSLAFPRNNSFLLFAGYVIALLIAYKLDQYFFGSVGSFNVWVDLTVGFLFIGSSIILAKLSVKYLLKEEI